jgi:hypothetical protein
MDEIALIYKLQPTVSTKTGQTGSPKKELTVNELPSTSSSTNQIWCETSTGDFKDINEVIAHNTSTPK